MPEPIDDNEKQLDDAVEQIQSALDRNDVGAAVNTLSQLQTDDQFEVFDELEIHEQAELLPRLEPDDAADILVELHEDDQAELAERVDEEALSDILDEMEPDDAADVLGDLSDDKKARVLAGMEQAAAEDVRELLIYPDESAGGLMNNSFLALRPHMTAQDAINALRGWGPDNELAYYMFVVDRDRRLVGIVSMRALITAPPTKMLSEIMSTDVVTVPVGTDQEECAQLLRKHGFLALPVVDGDSRLVGIITVDDLVDVIEEEAAEDTFRLAGMPDEERVFSSIKVSMQKRMPWLYINLATAFLAAGVVSLFQGTVEKVAIIAALQSIVAGQGGNAATQRITVLVRGLATGEADMRDALSVTGRETWLGLLQGLLMATVVGVGVVAWQIAINGAAAASVQKSLILGLVVGAAMLGNMVVAGLTGAAVPFLLKRVKLDPALSSAVIVTTFTDCCGFGFSLGFATLLLKYLT